MPFRSLAGRGIRAGHDKREFRAVIFNAAILRHFPMRIGKAVKKAEHHGVNSVTAFVFAKVVGMVGGVCCEQGFDACEVVLVGQRYIVFCQFYRFFFYSLTYACLDSARVKIHSSWVLSPALNR